MHHSVNPIESAQSLHKFDPISMRVPDACRYTGISRSTLYLLIARGEIEIIKMGASTLVISESLRAFVERQRQSRKGKKGCCPTQRNKHR